MKWEPFVAMAIVLALGVWLVLGPMKYLGLPARRAGAIMQPFRVGPVRGWLEMVGDHDAEPTFRILSRAHPPSGVLSTDQLRERLGDGIVDEVLQTGDNTVFRLFNITNWTSLIWITIGFGGQLMFFGRMAVQWVASERRQASVVPPAFWYLSLAGGLCLFTYFVWRQDLVGVLGQTSGIVIYARNIRLISKQNRREQRLAPHAAPEPEPAPAPAPAKTGDAPPGH